MASKHIVLTAAIIITFLFMVFVWPTQYRYDHSYVYGENRLIRINRFTDTIETVNEHGWSKLLPRKYEDIPRVEAPAATPAPVE